MSEFTRKAYEQLTDHYEFDVDTKPYNAYLERPAMVKQLPDLQGKHVLDAGCAAGWYSDYAASLGANVHALDLSASMIDATKRRTKGQVDAFVHDLNNPVPLQSESIDLVISSLTLHYIQDWIQPFQEFERLLKPKGMILFSIHHPFMDFTQFNVENYFKTSLLHDQWEVRGKAVEMKFYRRPMQEIINTLSNKFKLIKMIETQPTTEFKQVHPDSYSKVMTKPNFLIIKAEKPGP